MPAVPGDRRRKLDLAGLVSLAAAVGLFVVPLILGHDLGWPAWGWGMLAIGLIALLMFVAVERRVAARGGNPLIPAGVLHSPGLAPAAGAIFLLLTAFFGFSFIFALHMQEALKYSALRAGLLFLPQAVGFGVAGLYWRRLPGRIHRPLPVLSMIVAGLSFVGAGLVQRGSDGVGVPGEIFLLLIGVGAGWAYSPLFARALSRVAPEDAADASGVLVTVIQLGQVVGVALPGTLFLSQIHSPGSVVDSGHALAVTSITVGVVALCASVFAYRTRKAVMEGLR